jgi:hypothetical protein
MKMIKDILMYLWQLPQNILGLILRSIYKGNDTCYKDVIIRRSLNMRGGISLGKYVIVSQFSKEKTIMHEYGHCIQSKYLGWLYLPVVGIQSFIWSCLYGPVIKRTKNGYFKFWTEAWADKLGNVTRQEA